jgi:hypothetical protein
MHCTARFVVSAWLVVAATGCSDDGLNVQGLNSSSTGNSGGDSTGNATGPVTTADDHGGTGSVDGTSTGAGTQGNVDTSAGSSTSEIPTGSTGDATTLGGTTEGPGSSSEGPGTTEGSSSTGEVCEPINEDPSGIGGECINDVDCLDGYTCQPFVGIVFQLSCQILCTQDCECPLGYTCIEIADKSGSTWHQCA